MIQINVDLEMILVNDLFIYWFLVFWYKVFKY